MKYFVGVLVILFFVIVGILLFVGRDDTADVLSNQTDTSLAQHAEDPNSTVTWIKRGEIVAQENHYAIRVTVSANQRTIEVLQGYKENVIHRETYKNTKEAYSVFLKALENQGFNDTKEGRYDDVEGACPTGSRYLYRLDASMQSVVDAWSTSCSRRDGTFDGQASVVRKLFQAQIPDYNEIEDIAEF